MIFSVNKRRRRSGIIPCGREDKTSAADPFAPNQSMSETERKIVRTFGMALIERLQHCGYRLSPRTRYPLLHGLQKRDDLTAKDVRSGRVTRRLYRATPAGRRVLTKAREKVKELLGELLE